MSGLPALVVVLPSDLDQRLADRLRPVLIDTAEAGRDLVIDMRDAGTIDPAGLGLLVRAHRSARQHGATLCLVAPSRFVLTVLHTMRLDGVFPIFPDQRAALSGPARPAAMA
ncbi:STAS domain-containing protein [Actinoplanes xinjiangensis]|uniref:STAS domain-containing protein n=1 Tax=Actinoplanes xinjiangensis TaxID=512350 RepID=UPI003F4E0B76